MKLDTTKLKCKWCGTIIGTYLCTCGYRSCRDCARFPVGDRCIHERHEHIESDGWCIDGTNGT